MPEEKTTAELQAEIAEVKAENEGLKKNLTDSKPEVKPDVKPEVTPEVKAEKKEFSEESTKKLTELENKNKVLSEEIATLKKQDRKNAIELKCKEFKDAGVVPAIIDKAREIMLADNSAATYELSEKKEDGTVEAKKMTLSECIISLIDAMPTIELGESTVLESKGSSDTQTDGNVSDKDIIKKYMEDNKCVYRVALSELRKQGKLSVKSYDVGE